MNSTNGKLRFRTHVSLAVLIVGLVLAASAFESVQRQETVDGAPAFLRSAFEFNARVWHGLWSPDRTSVAKTAPAPGTPPRTNGDLGLREPIDTDYAVTVENGEREFEIPLREIMAQPRSQASTDFRCIEGWSRVVQYAGLKFSDFMEHFAVGRKPDGSYYKYVGLETPDEEYYVSIDMESMRHPQTILAYEMNQAPLKPENGAPLRLVIPIKYGIKSLKRVGRIFFSDKRPPDYWEEEGYDWYSGL